MDTSNEETESRSSLCSEYFVFIYSSISFKILSLHSVLNFKLLPKQFEEITIKLTGECEEQFMDKITLWEASAFLNEEDYLNENVDESTLKVFKEVD